MMLRLRDYRASALARSGGLDNSYAYVRAASLGRRSRTTRSRRFQGGLYAGMVLHRDGGQGMTIRSLSEIDASRTVQADVCVIGAGMAGLFLARQLCTLGIRVVVVESGRGLNDGDADGLNGICDEHGRYKWPVTGRARGLGGSSAVWGGKLIPLCPGDIEERPYVSAPEWPVSYTALLEGLGDVERFFCLDRGSYESDSATHMRTGYAFPRGDRDFAVRWAKWAGYRRGNVWSILSRQLHRLPDFDIWLDATVCEFTADPDCGRLAAATCQNQAGTRLAVAADHFVVAAGTIESTRLLLLLDQAQNGRVFEGCNVLGRYFQDHLDARLGRLVPVDAAALNRLFGTRYFRMHRRSPHLELTGAAQRADGVASAFVHVTADLSQNPTLATVKQIARAFERRDYPSLPAKLREGTFNPRLLGQFVAWRAMRHTLLLPRGIDINLRVCIEQSPRFENRIELAGARDRLGVKKVALKWLPGAADERTFRACAGRFADFWHRNGFERAAQIAWAEEAQDSGGSILDISQDYAHPSGTTRMGTDRVQSVVDPELFCHSVANLSVVSASCFPSAGSVNPTLTVMLLAWRSARAIARAVRRPAAALPQPAATVPGAANV